MLFFGASLGAAGARLAGFDPALLPSGPRLFGPARGRFCTQAESWPGVRASEIGASLSVCVSARLRRPRPRSPLPLRRTVALWPLAREPTLTLLGTAPPRRPSPRPTPFRGGRLQGSRAPERPTGPTVSGTRLRSGCPPWAAEHARLPGSEVCWAHGARAVGELGRSDLCRRRPPSPLLPKGREVPPPSHF